MRSISCIVFAVKQDSPQCEQDHIGNRSITRRLRPLPKVRATRLRSTPARPHAAQRYLDEVERDDVERAGGANLDDRFRFATIKGAPPDDDLAFTRFGILLALECVVKR
jgi:hypothetical protein